MANVPEPKTREELYLAKAAGKSVDTPTPETRLEMYLDAISQGGGGGGGGDLPAGGDAGEILAKKSSAAGDAGWIKPPYTKEQTDEKLAEKAALSVGKISTAGGGEEVHATVSQGSNTVSLNYYKQGQEPPDYINLNVDGDAFTFETSEGIRQQIAQKPSMSLEQADNTVTFGTDTELFSVTEETDDVLIQMAIPGEYETEFRVPKSEHVDALLSGKQDIMQFAIVPEASADNEGNVIQFVGATSPTFTNGFFYRCQEVTPATDPKTFEWVRVDVQPASGGETPTLDEVLETGNTSNRTMTVGEVLTHHADSGNETEVSPGVVSIQYLYEGKDKQKNATLLYDSLSFSHLQKRPDGAYDIVEDFGMNAANGTLTMSEDLKAAWREGVGAPFVATYEATTYEEVKAAIDANRAIVVNFPNNNNLICVTFATYTAGQNITMSGIYKYGNDISATSLTLTPADAWSISNADMQGKLVSGQNIKTINNQSLVGSGNIDVCVVFNAGTNYPYSTMATALRQGNVLIKDGSVNHTVVNFSDDSSEETLYVFVEGGFEKAPSQVCYKWIGGAYEGKTEKFIIPTGGTQGQVLIRNSTSIGDYGWADNNMPVIVGSDWGVAKEGFVRVPNSSSAGATVDVDISDLNLASDDDYEVLFVGMSDSVYTLSRMTATSFTVKRVDPSPNASTVVRYVVFAKGYGSTPSGGTTGQVLTKKSNTDGDVEWADAGGGTEAVVIDLDTFTMTKEEFELLFYSDKLIYIKDGNLNHLVTDKYTWDMLPEIVYELSYIENKTVVKYTWWVTDDIYYQGKDRTSIGVDNAVNAEKWYGTYTDENGVTYQVYTKTIYIPALPATAGITTYPHGIINIKQILSAYGFTTDGFVLNAPRQSAADNIAIYQVQKSSTGGIAIEVGKDRSSKSAYVTLVYAKNN